MSTLLVRTLRNDPGDATVASHKLLVRAGYVRRAAPGIFSWLPLGLMVLRNVERIVREEMGKAGCQEVHFPALLSGGREDEMFAQLVKDTCTSYRDLPVSLFQIRTTFRDEPRPRSGLLRSREFVTGDFYSFDLDGVGLQGSYAVFRAACARTLDRIGLPFVIVTASSTMDEPTSEEFLAPLDAGDDDFVVCGGCDYAANIKGVRIGESEKWPMFDEPAAHIEETPGTPTIQTLVDRLNDTIAFRRLDREWTAADTLKNVLVILTHPDGSEEPLAVGLPGDRDLDLKRLAAAVAPARVDVFGEAEFAARPRLVKGYIGPGALGESRGVRYLVDPRVVDGSRWVTGADVSGRHVIDLVAGRDFRPDGTIDAAEVRDGDPCPRCGAGLTLRQGIEIGRLVQLGTEFAKAQGLELAGPDGQTATVAVGSYRLGVSRALAAVAEATLDARGLCWPRAITPADIHLVTAGRDPAVVEFADQLADSLSAAGVPVLYDDRTDASAGVKFKDAELIGVPTIVVVGKGLAEGTIEVRDRRSGAIAMIPAVDATHRLVALCRAGRAPA